MMISTAVNTSYFALDFFYVGWTTFNFHRSHLRRVPSKGTCLSLTALIMGTFRQRLHGTGSVWNRYKIGTNKPCVYTGPGGSDTDRICYLVPNWSTYEGDTMWDRTVPVDNR